MIFLLVKSFVFFRVKININITRRLFGNIFDLLVQRLFHMGIKKGAKVANHVIYHLKAYLLVTLI